MFWLMILTWSEYSIDIFTYRHCCIIVFRDSIIFGLPQLYTNTSRFGVTRTVVFQKMSFINSYALFCVGGLSPY